MIQYGTPDAIQMMLAQIQQSMQPKQGQQPQQPSMMSQVSQMPSLRPFGALAPAPSFMSGAKSIATGNASPWQNPDGGPIPSLDAPASAGLDDYYGGY
jgi:hypothetical protein